MGCEECKRLNEQLKNERTKYLHMTNGELYRLACSFLHQMLAKLGKKELEGWRGSGDLSEEEIKDRIAKHVKKGDPVDVANYCVFWWALLQEKEENNASDESTGA